MIFQYASFPKLLEDYVQDFKLKKISYLINIDYTIPEDDEIYSK